MTTTTPDAIGAPTAHPRRCPPYRSADERGEPIVIVPLPDGSREAVCDAADYDALAARGLATGWTFNTAGPRGYGYVRVGRARFSGGLETVARLILNAGPGKLIRYRDRNPLNLRRHNLWAIPRTRCGKGWGRAS